MPGQYKFRPLIYNLAIDSVTHTVYAATTSGVYKGVNGASGWSLANSGIPANTPVGALAINPATPTTIYAWSGLAGQSLFKSTDGATSWTIANSGLPNTNVRALVIDPGNPSTVYAGT